MKKIAIAMLATFILSASAQTSPPMEGWVTVAKTKTTKWDYKVNSARLGKTYDERHDVVKGVVREHTQGSSVVDLRLWTVYIEACENGFGQVAVSAVDGSIPITSSFAFGGGDVGSAVAKAICDQRPK